MASFLLAFFSLAMLQNNAEPQLQQATPNWSSVSTDVTTDTMFSLHEAPCTE